MDRRTWLIISGILIPLGILMLLLKLILKLNLILFDSFSGAFLGVGIGILLITLFRKKKK